MEIRSLAYQTDLALHRLGGSIIEDKGDYLVTRTPANPTFWWGNFILLAEPPGDDATRWIDTFEREFPDAGHLAIGIDGPDGTLDDLQAFADAGLDRDLSSVMTAQRVHPPPRPNADATYRALISDDDWSQRVDLQVACRDDWHDEASYRVFAQRSTDTMRGLAERTGDVAWFGAFEDGALRSSMGLFRTGTGLARYQTVETHPDARGRGLAGTLVHHVATYGFEAFGAHTLVMVADPSYLAIRIYRSVGFSETENQLQVQRPHT